MWTFLLLPAATKLWPRLCFYSCLWFCPQGRVSASVYAGIPPPGSRHPPEQTTPPSRHPPGADTPRKADSSIQSMSGRYASYWNAFLFAYKITKAFGLPKQSLFSNYRVMLLLCHLRVNWIQAVKVRIVMWYHLASYWLLVVMCIQSVDSL